MNQDEIPWAYSQAVREIRDLGSGDSLNSAASVLELWERRGATVAMFSAFVGGPRLFEVWAGRTHLREVDHELRHQVLRQGVEPEWAARIVRAEAGMVAPPRPLSANSPSTIAIETIDEAAWALTVDSDGLPMSLEGSSFAVAWTFTVRRAPTIAGPRHADKREWSWEHYVSMDTQRLTKVVGLSGLPVSIRSEPVDDAFLYFSSADTRGSAHVAWRASNGHEIELVVGALTGREVPFGSDELSNVAEMDGFVIRASATNASLATAAAAALDVHALVRCPIVLPSPTFPSFFLA